MRLIPAVWQEWLSPHHLAYFTSDVVDQLDLGQILSRYQREWRGYLLYDPVMMVEVRKMELLRKAGLVKLGHGFLEETKVKLNTSKNKATS